jgi:hypothetical protein
MLRRLLLAGVFAFVLIESAQVTREGSLSIEIAGGPVRVTLQDGHGTRPHVKGAVAISDSAIPIPRQALAAMWGQQDRAEGYALQPDGSFYVESGFDVRVPPGDYTVTLSKGFEYKKQEQHITVAAGAAVKQSFRMERWTDMPDRGWYSSDDHIHLRRSPGDDKAIVRWLAAEDIHVGNLLQMGDFFSTYFSQYAFGDAGRYQEGDRVLVSGQEEPRTPEIGHTISLGAREFVRMSRDYYSFDRIFDRVHELGGLTGFAHQGMSFHGYRGMTLNILRGKIDFLELAQFCVPEGPLPVEHYYRFLDMGYKVTALAGSDFPWCGPKFAQIGNARFYAYAGKPFRYDRFFDAVRAGHTFVTTGPMVFLTVNGKMPGDTLAVARGSKLHIEAEGTGTVQIIGHSKVLGQAPGKVALDLPVNTGVWIAARVDNGPGQVAHTTPVYVTVDGRFENPANLTQNIAISEGFLQEIEAELAHPGTNLDDQAARHRAALERQIAETRAKLRALVR